MGGLVLQRMNLHGMPDLTVRVLRGSDGYRRLHQFVPECIPRLGHAEVIDRSKASATTKLLILAQALWSVSQCITRMAQHLDITLLEPNTFTHCVCAAFMYGSWWHKLYDVASRVLLIERDGLLQLMGLEQQLCATLLREFGLFPGHSCLYVLTDGSTGQSGTL